MQYWNVVIVLDPPDIKSYLEIILFSYAQDTAECLSKNLQLLHFKANYNLIQILEFSRTKWSVFLFVCSFFSIIEESKWYV